MRHPSALLNLYEGSLVTGHYRLEPLQGKLFAIKTFEEAVEEPEPMKFDLYGEY